MFLIDKQTLTDLNAIDHKNFSLWTFFDNTSTLGGKSLLYGYFNNPLKDINENRHLFNDFLYTDDIYTFLQNVKKSNMFAILESIRLNCTHLALLLKEFNIKKQTLQYSELLLKYILQLNLPTFSECKMLQYLFVVALINS